MSRARILLLACLTGCTFSSTQEPTVIDNSCAGDADCAQGTCDEHICIDASSASVEVAIEVLRTPADVAERTPASWMFPSKRASGPTAFDLQLPATRQVQGVVRWNDTRIPATLRFVRRMQDTADSPAVEVQTYREEAGGTGDIAAFDYSVTLVAGQTYDVVVLPSTDVLAGSSATESVPAVRSLPPLYLELAMDDADPAEPFRFDVEFPSELADPCTADRDVGCTLEAQVLTVDGSDPVPEPGLQVRAIDAIDGRVVSSIGETDESGRVAIRIDETASDYLIRVTSSLGRAPFPAVSVDPAVAFTDPNERIIYIPRLSSIQVSGRVRDLDDTPVPGATVRFFSTGIFDSTELGLQGSFNASATTDEDGAFGVELLAGFYTVTVTPPSDAENTWGVLTAQAAVGGELTAIQALIVPSQIELRGWVETFRNEVAPGLTIVARARPSADSQAMHRSQEVATNAIGAFSAHVDEGIYDVHVKVPSETGFPWLVEPALSMSAERGDQARIYELVPPIPIRGTLRAGDGSGVEGALIRGYVFAESGGQARRIQVAETISGEGGRYRLLIAPQFAAP